MRKILLFIFIVCILSSCSSKNQNIESENPISVSVFDRKLVASSEGDYQNNRWTRWVNENSPVAVRWIPVSFKNYEQALSIMFASKSAPDLISCNDRLYFQNLADSDFIKPIDEYIETYSVQYKDYIADNENLRIYTQLNNCTYLFTSEAETTADSGIWIRRDWLENVGLDVPQNTDELLSVARAFVNDDPDANGINDTIAISICSDVLDQIFGVDQNWYRDSSGVLYHSALSDRFIDMLLYKKQLFDEYLIDREFVTDINSQRQLKAFINGNSGILFGNWYADDFRDLIKSNPHADIVPVPSISTPYTNGEMRLKAPTSNYVAFNTQFDNPKAGVLFIDWMISKGYQTLLYGFEGEHYINEYGFRRPIDVEKNNIELKYATYDMPILRRGTKTTESILKLVPPGSPIDAKIAELNAMSLELCRKNGHRQDIPVDIFADSEKIRQFEIEWNSVADKIQNDVVLSSLNNLEVSRDIIAEMLKSEWYKLDGDNILPLIQNWYEKNSDVFYYGTE